MSKSKKNTIDPERMMANYGADAVRFFILSDSPPEKDVQWSEQGMQASFKFIQKFWELNSLIIEKISSKSENENNDEINVFTNEILNKITFNIENFHYNVIIANLHEIYNFYNKIVKKNLNTEALKTNYTKIFFLINFCIINFFIIIIKTIY